MQHISILTSGFRHLPFVICMLLLSHLSFHCYSRSYPLWDNIKPGIYHVGFKRIYSLDSSRTYALRFLPKINEDTALYHRPMVINIWYPTNDSTSECMNYEEYYNFNTQDTLWHNFLIRVKEFNIQVTKDNSFTKPKGKNIDQLMLFNTLLKTPTSIHKNATHTIHKHPLILYYPGMGGTVEESSLLCEYLASHGYVVISSLYQPEHRKHLYSDWDLDRSMKDRDFMISSLRNEHYIDFSGIGLLGFSFGAQSGLYYEGCEHYPIKAVVVLDSRLEYSFNCHPLEFKNLPDTLLKKKIKIKAPMLCFSESGATYELFDSLLYCDRYYARVPFLEHYNFTSQSAISQFLNYTADTTLCLLKTKWELYKAICLNTLNFYNASFKQTPASFKLKLNGNCNDQNHEMQIAYETRKKGQSRESSCSIPNITLPIQLIRFIQQKSYSYVEKNYPDLLSNQQLLSEEINNRYGYYLMEARSLAEALKIFEWNAKLFPNSWNAFDSLGDVYAKNNNREKALVAYRKSLELNPDNTHATKMINTLIE